MVDTDEFYRVIDVVDEVFEMGRRIAGKLFVDGGEFSFISLRRSSGSSFECRLGRRARAPGPLSLRGGRIFFARRTRRAGTLRLRVRFGDFYVMHHRRTICTDAAWFFSAPAVARRPGRGRDAAEERARRRMGRQGPAFGERRGLGCIASFLEACEMSTMIPCWFELGDHSVCERRVGDATSNCSCQPGARVASELVMGVVGERREARRARL